LQQGEFPPPLLIKGKLTDPVPFLIDGGWVSEFVDITPTK
jgi:hypothetical protein